MEKSELITQTKLAFDFIQKLYYEVSYLFKEIEGLLSEEDEEFVFGRASGYAVTARTSNGLDPTLVRFWMFKKIAVFFIPKSFTKLEGGQTITRFEVNPKIIYIRVVLDDKDIKEPLIYFGVLKDFIKKEKKWLVKVEQIMASIEYNEARAFKSDGSVDFEDGNASFKGKLSHVDLYDISNSADIVKKIITPLLKQFREA
jgi:hypothetical protein